MTMDKDAEYDLPVAEVVRRFKVIQDDRIPHETAMWVQVQDPDVDWCLRPMMRWEDRKWTADEEFNLEQEMDLLVRGLDEQRQTKRE